LKSIIIELPDFPTRLLPDNAKFASNTPLAAQYPIHNVLLMLKFAHFDIINGRWKIQTCLILAENMKEKERVVVNVKLILNQFNKLG
jgi:hypothetical protein